MDNRQTINRYLGNRGLATLENPGAMVQQLGFLVEDDQHLKQILNKCEPHERRNCYEALRPHFASRRGRWTSTSRSWDGGADPGVADSGQRRQVPRLRTPEIRSVQAAVDGEMAKHHLTLTCRKCTREETFHGERRAEVIFKAREAGWTYGLDGSGKGKEICPSCPCLRN